ncbi:Uncharacterized protein Rs2_30946 [Raphanus sativus]|nr:Uncharacterized protein Rs2_30946 [Raphanus sativus]
MCETAQRRNACPLVKLCHPLLVVGRRRDRKPGSHRNRKSPTSVSREVDVVIKQNPSTGLTGNTTTTTGFHPNDYVECIGTGVIHGKLEHIRDKRKPATTIREKTVRPQKQTPAMNGGEPTVSRRPKTGPPPKISMHSRKREKSMR